MHDAIIGSCCRKCLDIASAMAVQKIKAFLAFMYVLKANSFSITYLKLDVFPAFDRRFWAAVSVSHKQKAGYDGVRWLQESVSSTIHPHAHTHKRARLF